MWEELQRREEKSYKADFNWKGTYLGHFSVPEFEPTVTIAEYVSNVYKNALCLDVGCGILPRPSYMGGRVTYYGVDPFFGEYRREFPFAQSVGEHLPFRSNTFGLVSFMSSLDHAIVPISMLREGRRVLKDGGTVVVWTELRTDRDIAVWKTRGGLYNDYHQWAFSRKTLMGLLGRAGFRDIGVMKLTGRYGKYPDTYLFTGEAV